MKNILWRVQVGTRSLEILSGGFPARDGHQLFGVSNLQEIPFSNIEADAFDRSFLSPSGKYLRSCTCGRVTVDSKEWVYGVTVDATEKIWADRLLACCKQFERLNELDETSEEKVFRSLSVLSQVLDDCIVQLWRIPLNVDASASLIARYIPPSKKQRDSNDDERFLQNARGMNSPVWTLASSPSGKISTYVGVFPVLRRHDREKVLEITLDFPEESSSDCQSASEPIIRMLTQFIRMQYNEKRLLNTERALSRSHSELKVLFESSPIGIAIALDATCEKIKVNPSAARMLGVHSEEYYSKSSTYRDALQFKVLSHGEEVSPDQLPLQRAGRGEYISELRLDIEHQDGQCVNLFEYAYPLLDENGSIQGALGFFVDVTALQNIERRLEEQLAQMRLADARKDRFIALLGHELRNPLAAISSASNLLRQPSMESKREWVLDMLHRQIKNLGRLLDDLLDVARMEHDKLTIHPERVELKSIITRACETVQSLYDSKEQKIVFELPSQLIFVDADPTRLEQIIGNLLTNSGKYSDKGQTVYVSATQRNKDAVITIKDSGLGIAPEILPHIFEAFTQALPTHERSKEGLGLGLALVKGLVELHGGKILAESEGQGKGSTFTVKIPLAQSQPEANEIEKTGEDTNLGNSSLRIFVVDDNQDAAQALSAYLESFGHQVSLACTGQEAMLMGKRLPFDIVFLDIGLPDMSGYEVAKHLKSLPLHAQTHFIAITGFGQPQDISRSLKAGFLRHFVKPIDFNAIEHLLKELVLVRQ